MKIWHISPAKCAICGFYACYDELPVCRKCMPTLQEILTVRCKACGKTPANCECDNNTRCLFFFSGWYAKKLIYLIKTNADERTIYFFAELMIKACGIKPSAYDGVTYVPRLRRNVRRYGFDQAKEIAKAISKIYDLPLICALERVGGRDQKLLSRAERLKNIRGRYRVKNPPKKKYRRLLLVDDVTTTGATLEACAQLLRSEVTESLTKLVIAKTVLNKK